ncbi:MAG: hypothetical protein KUG81_10235 [Gammaproteobacteria bacterium]|nr:hypothetical protein [Gammaproteobacteria bacterium]
MAVEKQVNIKVTETGLDEINKDLKQLDTNINKVDDSSKSASKGLKDVGENGGAIAVLDSLTGGLATRLRDSAEASKLFNFSLKGMRTALIATGIGAFVVALGLIVVFWDDIRDAITGANEELEKQIALNNKIAQQLENLKFLRTFEEQQLKTQIEQEVLRARIAKKSEEDIFKIRQDGANKLIEIRQGEADEANRILNEAATADLETYEKAAAEQEAAFKRLGEARSALIQTQLEEELRISNLKPNQSRNTGSAVGGELESAKLQIQADFNAKSLDLTDELIRHQAQKALKAAADEKILAESVARAKVDIAYNTLALVGEIAGEGSKVGKAVAAAQATISGIEGVQSAYSTAQKSPITTLFPAYPLIQAGLAGAFSAIQIKKILSVDPTGRTQPNLGGGSGGGQSAPSFNVVGTSGVNQLAQTLQGQDEPIQAYVVANDVTTQQSLDRNIVETATIG